MRTSQGIVVVGAGQASAWAIKTLRDDGFDGTIRLVGAEGHLPYERPPLSKAILSGDADFGSAYIFPSETYREMGVDLHLSTSATNIDIASNSLTLSDKTKFFYSQLLIATGGVPRRLRLPGSDLKGIHYLRTLSDSAAIRESLTSNAHILIVGGGWIGLEVAATARKLRARVTLAEYAARLASRCVPPEISALLQSLHADHGVDLKLNARLKSFDGSGQVERVEFEDGSVEEISAAVIGIGLDPSTELADAAGIAVSNGILVDEFWRTSAPSVYAAGDVASFVSRSGDRMRLESWDNAQKQGIAAAKGILGSSIAPDHYPWFWSDQYDQNIQLIGDTTRGGDIRGVEVAGRDGYLNLYLDRSTIVGAIAINAGREMRQLKRLMQPGNPVQLSDLARSRLAVKSS